MGNSDYGYRLWMAYLVDSTLFQGEFLFKVCCSIIRRVLWNHGGMLSVCLEVYCYGKRTWHQYLFVVLWLSTTTGYKNYLALWAAVIEYTCEGCWKLKLFTTVLVTKSNCTHNKDYRNNITVVDPFYNILSMTYVDGYTWIKNGYQNISATWSSRDLLI